MGRGRMQNHRHLPAFILLDLAQQSNYGNAIHSNLIRDIPEFQCDTAAVYRTLNQLEKIGAVVSRWDTAHPGAARKIYNMTDKGYEELAFWKNDVESRIKKLTYFLRVYKTVKK